MKIRITLKDPDRVYDAVQDAVQGSLEAHEGLDDDEKEAIMETRINKTWAILEKFIQYQEYITVEFDTVDGTARVVPTSETLCHPIIENV